jgi:hypothetical protein
MSKPRAKEMRYALPEASLFTESGVKFLAAYRFWIVGSVWLAARAYAIWGLSPDYLVESYFQMAGDWLDGFTPYTAFKVEYPPGALVLFVLPRIFVESLIGYGYVFAFVMLLADLGILLLLGRIAALVFGANVQRDTVGHYKSTLLGLIYVLFSAFFGRLLFQHYDLIMGLLLLAVIDAALRKKTARVDLLLAAGIWFNLTALAWIPLLWWYGFVSREESLPSKKRLLKISAFSRALLPRMAVLAAGLGVLFLPFILLSGRSLGYIVQFHLERGIQLESTAAGILMLGAKIFGVELATESIHQAIQLSGELSSRGAVLSGILSILIFVIISIYAARKMQDADDAPARRQWLIRGLAATILALLASSKVFRPQSLLWVAPLAALLAHADQPRFRDAGWRLFGVNLLTLVLFFFYYPELVKLQLLPGILLLLRNMGVIWVVISLLRSETPAVDQREVVSHIPWHLKKILTHLPVILLFIWGTIAAFCPASSNDLWLLLREAADIVASGEVPQVEQYSAVAAGRPYLAHEWLSGLVFLGIFKLGGGEALTVLRASVMLAMLFLLWYSLEKKDRSFMLAAPLLALAAYTILVRVFVRPHIFTHLFLCVWVFSLEHWRRERRLGYLIMLVPLQVLWANLHGGYIFAVVLGALMTGTTAVLVLRPGWSKDERYAWSDVRTLAALTVACLAASLVNPNGLQLLEFSLDIGLASDYIKQTVFEWGSPLGPKYARSYGREAALGIFFLVWLGLALNVKRRPFLDVILALLATLMAVQAIRFISFIGILGFPLAVRTWRAVADTQANSPPVRRRPLIEAVLYGLLLASTLIYGFPYGAAKHRQVGWGMGGRMPYKATRFLAEQGFEGTIFNDYGDGAFLIYHLYPKVRPVMDSRIDVYGPELAREYFASRDDPLKFFQYLNKYNVARILLRKSQKNLQINQYLGHIPATKLLLETDDRMLYAYDPMRLPPEILQQKAP